MYEKQTEKIFLHISALLGCHHHGVLTVVKVVLSNDPTYATQPHTCTCIHISMKTRAVQPTLTFQLLRLILY